MKARPKEKDKVPRPVRVVERQLLDRRHLQEPLLDRDQQTAIPYLLRAYAHIIRDSLPSRAEDYASWEHHLGVLTHALEQAIRWVLGRCSTASSVPTAHWSTLDSEALDLLSWALTYVKLSMDHTAASRGLYIATVDEKNHVIAFSMPADVEHTFLLAQGASERVHAAMLHRDIPHKILDSMFKSWADTIELSTVSGGEDLPDIWEGSKQVCYPSVRAWVDSVIFPELDDATQLGSFTLGDLRKFWSHLFIGTRMITQLEERIDRRLGPENAFGSVVFEGPTNEIVDFFSVKWDIPHQIVGAIVDVLTFTPLANKDSLGSSVFLRTTDGLTYLLCWRVQLADPGRMLSLAIARKSPNKLYDSLITRIEQSRVADITVRLRDHGLVSITGSELRTRDTAIHPDLWLYEPLTSKLFACDYKHAIPPFGPAEVANRLNDLESWKQQIRRYIRFVSKHKSYVCTALGLPAISECGGMLVLRWPMPIPAKLAADVIVADWPSLKSVLDVGETLDFETLRRFYATPRHVSNQLPVDVKAAEQDIVVGAWTYRHPIVQFEAVDLTQFKKKQ